MSVVAIVLTGGALCEVVLFFMLNRLARELAKLAAELRRVAESFQGRLP